MISHLYLSAILFIFTPPDRSPYCGLSTLVLVSHICPPLLMACSTYPLSLFVPSRSFLLLVSPSLPRSAFSHLALHSPSPSPFLSSTFRSVPCFLSQSSFSRSPLFFQRFHSLGPLFPPLYCPTPTSLTSPRRLALLSAPSLFSTCSISSVSLCLSVLFTPSPLHTCYSHLSPHLSLPLYLDSISVPSFRHLLSHCCFRSLSHAFFFCTSLFSLPIHFHSALFFVCPLCSIFTFYLPRAFSIYSVFSPYFSITSSFRLFRHSSCLIAASISARIS